MLSFIPQIDEARKFFNLALRSQDDNAIRIKLAMLMPAVYTSVEEMTKWWNDELIAFKKLLARPSLKLQSNALVILTHSLVIRSYSLLDRMSCPLPRFISHTPALTTKNT